MKLEKTILASVTMNRDNVTGGSPIYVCDNKEEMDQLAANLEAILDGISHALSDELYIIVKH
ncbi:capping complex subunit for YIEGIA [Pontibacillus litoralis]|uniref:Uncharacterized protein n=1 Tax=Pontibacillus litoralis JSM 072002 TaxID=1385512 RepID=A0A0A5G4D7_9BACI|nr:hypothetical protein [Pontibacillus litoralis]KGX87976.1 hypothetical protein N784_12840 [Pontibacillus litoralis JSM 072002]